MSDDSDLLISVPRSSLPEFYNKYLKLVETFYYVTLSENKSVVSNHSNNVVYFKVNFHLDPVIEKFNREELIDRIQVGLYSIFLSYKYSKLTIAVYLWEKLLF